MASFFTHTRKKQSIAIDIGTSAVRAALFSYASDTNNAPVRPAVLDVIASPYRKVEMVDASVLHESALRGIEHVVSAYGGRGRIESVLVGFSTPFYISRTARVLFRRPQPHLPLQNAEVRAFQKKGREEFVDSLTGRMQGDAVYIFTQTLLKTFINGYRVENPEGAEGAVVEIVARYEATTKDIIHNFEGSIARHIHASHIQFTSLPLAFFYLVGSVADANNGFAVVDIGAEITEVSVVRNGVLERVVVVPLGVHALVRRVMEAFHRSWDNAQFLVKSHGEGTLEETYKTRLESVERELQREWQESIASRLTSSLEDPLPPHIFLTGGGSTLPVFRDAYTKEFLERLLIRGRARIEVAGPSLIADQFERQSFSSSADFGLACLVLLSARGVV